ncbi:MAG TPA: OmpA family protein [Polyangiaceae bacterium]
MIRVSFAGLALASLVCCGQAHAPAAPSCAPSAWAGSCRLSNLLKVEDRVLPIPYVVYEATYSPERSASSPAYTPPDVRLRFGAAGQYEFALADHLHAQSVVACRLQPAPSGCVSETLTADVVPFDPERVPSATPAHATGCAAIEASSEQDRVRRQKAPTATFAERFSFEQDSATLPPDAQTTAANVATRLKGDPTLECVAVVGQVASGESLSLAESRARAVKQLLISLGVDAKRLQTITLSASVFGPGAKPPEADAADRHVSLKVLLQTTPAARP